MTALEQEERQELMALSLPPSKKACAFSGMTSYGSHYRVDMEEGTSRHVTYDSGVAEFQCRQHPHSSSESAMQVELIRVGVLKNILVLNYGNLNLVLMVVSWVSKHTEESPRLRRDPHGFWLANMAARPRDTTNPYILPVLASQVNSLYINNFYQMWGGHCCRQTAFVHLNHTRRIVQVFFVHDKNMPGWSVVLKKEARGRRINSTEVDHGLGQEPSMDDLQVLTNMEPQARRRGDGFGGDEASERQSGNRRRRTGDFI
jgi:hypothetical protein